MCVTSDRSYFIRGRARVTIFASAGVARTFDYTAGDVGIVPRNMGHYVENLSDTEEVEVIFHRIFSQMQT